MQRSWLEVENHNQISVLYQVGSSLDLIKTDIRNVDHISIYMGQVCKEEVSYMALDVRKPFTGLFPYLKSLMESAKLKCVINASCSSLQCFVEELLH